MGEVTKDPLMVIADATTPQEPYLIRRNPPRNRRPPEKLSFESQVVCMEVDQQKIERGRKM